MTTVFLLGLASGSALTIGAVALLRWLDRRQAAELNAPTIPHEFGEDDR